MQDWVGQSFDPRENIMTPSLCSLVPWAILLVLFAGLGGAETEEPSQLVRSSQADGDAFGLAVSVSGDTAIVGASQGGAASAPPGAGYAVVFQAGGAADGWEEVERLVASECVRFLFPLLSVL